MDDERDDSGDPDDADDDVTIVGDHELVVELRRLAADRPDAPGRPLPPPAPPVRPSRRPAGRAAASRRPQPPAPRPAPAAAGDEWWDDAEGDRPRVMWLVIALAVAAAAVVAMLLLR
jgi:hypothetical protein